MNKRLHFTRSSKNSLKWLKFEDFKFTVYLYILLQIEQITIAKTSIMQDSGLAFFIAVLINAFMCHALHYVANVYLFDITICSFNYNYGFPTVLGYLSSLRNE